MSDHNAKIHIQLTLDADAKVMELLVNGTPHQPVRETLVNGSAEGCYELHGTAKEESLGPKDAAAEGRKTLLAQTRNGILTIFLLILIEAVIEGVLFWRDSAFLSQFLEWILYLDITVVSLVVAIGYLRSYRYANTNHMISMMIGMTVGMQAGMMTGGVIGATDGYFMGAIVGVGLGTLLGVGTAWCCGPMAITQALMSGVMGGTMGSMIVAMMPPEKLGIFMPIFTLLNITILVWFSFLFFKDCVVGERCHLDRQMPFWRTFLLSTLAVSGLGGLMVLNPEHSEHFRHRDAGGTLRNPFKSDFFGSSEKIHPATEMRCGASMFMGDVDKK